MRPEFSNRDRNGGPWVYVPFLSAPQLAAVAELRAKRPRKPMSPKLAISLKDWILEAIAEKIERQQET